MAMWSCFVSDGSTVGPIFRRPTLRYVEDKMGTDGGPDGIKKSLAAGLSTCRAAEPEGAPWASSEGF